jgi:hypothetical protein
MAWVDGMSLTQHSHVNSNTTESVRAISSVEVFREFVLLEETTGDREVKHCRLITTIYEETEREHRLCICSLIARGGEIECRVASLGVSYTIPADFRSCRSIISSIPVFFARCDKL